MTASLRAAMGRSRKLVIAAAIVLGLLIVAGGLTTVLTGGEHGRSARHQFVAAPPGGPFPPSTSAEGQSPIPPATTIPAETPVQQQYDQQFAQGYSSAASKAMIARADALRLPIPAIGGGWPSLAVSNTPDAWARTFVQGLLTIDFAQQSRGSLGGWLVAQEASDLMPGIPVGFQDRALYVSVMAPEIMAQPPLIPSAAQWETDAMAGVRWAVSGLQVQLDPRWQSMIDAGWQPVDIRASVEDVSGLLTVTRGTTTETRGVSITLAVGSARWHQGYGTVAVTVPGG